MKRWRWLLAAAAAVAVVAAAVAIATGGLPARRTSPPVGFSFAVLGDAPYSRHEDRVYPLVLRDMDAHDLDLVIHVGDILAGPCSDERFRRSLDWFNGLRHPVVYTPGDNEWTDCGGDRKGEFQPRERLARLRQMFFPQPSRSLGGRPLAVISQAGDPAFPEFVENARWSVQGLVFITVHIVGSGNGLRPYGGRREVPDAAAQAEATRRTAAAAAWLREGFAAARASHAAAVVVAFQAFAYLEEPPGHQGRQPFEPFLLTLEEEVERFGGPVLAVHGDFHRYIVDQPMVRRTTGRRLDNLTRMQVPGSPDVGWVWVGVTPGPPVRFTFEARVVPRWRRW